MHKIMKKNFYSKYQPKNTRNKFQEQQCITTVHVHLSSDLIQIIRTQSNISIHVQGARIKNEIISDEFFKTKCVLIKL